MTDHELLVSLFEFLKARDFVLGNEGSVRDMVTRYARPPLTMHYRCAMQLTMQDYKDLALLLSKIDAHLKQENTTEETREPA